MKLCKTYLAIATTAVLMTAASEAATTFTGLDLGTGANWSNGLPSTGNDGTIAVDGTLNTITASGQITHSAGTINTTGGSGDASILAAASTALVWNQTGGTVTSASNGGFRVLTLGSGVTYNLSGGTIDFGTLGGTRLQLSANSTFNMTGGVLQDGSLYAPTTGGVYNLSGGTVTNFHRGFQFDTGNAVANISGTFSITSVNTSGSFDLTTLANYVSGSGSLIFSNTWTGFFAQVPGTTWTATDWTNAFASDNVFVGATKVTAGNFNNFFQVAANGDLSMVPEPSTALLSGLGMLGLLTRRRRQAC